jgi:hypothetical protein
MKEIKGKYLADDSVSAVSIDYMQNLSLPSIPVQGIFYLRHLTVYVFNIHDFNLGRQIFTFAMREKGGKSLMNFVLSFSP